MGKILDQTIIDALRTRLNIAIDHENITTEWLLNIIEEFKAENERLKQSYLTWKERANIYADLIILLNNTLPIKQEKEVNFQKVIYDAIDLQKATDESLYASRELYEEEKTKRWALEKQLKEKDEGTVVLEKALELACRCLRSPFINSKEELINSMGCFKKMARKELKKVADKKRIEERKKEKVIKNNLLSLSHEDLVELTLQYMFECRVNKNAQNIQTVEVLKDVSRCATECGQDDYFHYDNFQSYIQDLIKKFGGSK